MMRTTRRATLLAAPALLLSRFARAETVLRIGDQRGGVAAVMKAADALRDLPYRLEWSQFAAAAPLMEAVNANAVDTAFAGDAPVTFALASGVEARIIAATRGTGSSTAIMVPGGSSIRSAADLRGKRIATNRGSIGHALLLAVAEAGGWAAGDIKMVNLLPADAKAALASGAVDAWSTWNTYVAQAEINDGARVVIDGRDGLLSGLSFQVARSDAIRAKHDVLADYVGRVARARRWALDNPEAYAAVLATEIGVTPAIALRAFQIERPAPVRLDDRVAADEQRTADRHANARVIPQRLDTGPAFDRSFNGAALG